MGKAESSYDDVHTSIGWMKKLWALNDIAKYQSRSANINRHLLWQPLLGLGQK